MSTPFQALLNASKKAPGECDGWHAKLFGKIILNDNEETALSADQFVRRKDLPIPNRVLVPNSMVTMDYRPERLNIQVDDTMRVTGVNYG